MTLPSLPSATSSKVRLPAWIKDTGLTMRRHVQAEWFGSPFHLLMLRGSRTTGPAAGPRNPRPADIGRGQAIQSGIVSLAGQTMRLGPGGEPWDKPSPSRRFAEALHQMAWISDLLAAGDSGEREALRLILEWRRVFGRWNTFSWSGPQLERRAFNLACAYRKISAKASDLETSQIGDSLARHARQLLMTAGDPARAAERTTIAAIVGTSLAGTAGEALLKRALPELETALQTTVLGDGGHASRSPQAGFELLMDLLTLDDGLAQTGRAPPMEVSRAIERLTVALRFFALPDGMLACFQGGEAGKRSTVAAVRAACNILDTPAPANLSQSGYQRLAGKTLNVIADAAAPAAGVWSETACAQPLAIEILAGGERLITNCGWTDANGAPTALRLIGAGSTLSLGDGSPGEPASGRTATNARTRLRGDLPVVTARRHETPQGAWLEMAHDGWVRTSGLRHERLLYLDRQADELRGEDHLAPHDPDAPSHHNRVLPASVRFHLAPGVRATIARDGKSVLIQGVSTQGWWLRNDAQEVMIEPSVHYRDGLAVRTQQVVLRVQVSTADGGKIRWKMAAVEMGAG